MIVADCILQSIDERFENKYDIVGYLFDPVSTQADIDSINVYFDKRFFYEKDE